MTKQLIYCYIKYHVPSITGNELHAEKYKPLHDAKRQLVQIRYRARQQITVLFKELKGKLKRFTYCSQ